MTESDDKIAATIERSRLASIQSRFQAFHEANPEVYAELVELCRKAKRAGRRRIGIRVVWEVVRWNRLIQPDRPDSDFKMNDHYHSRYVRLIVKENPDLAEMFEMRMLKAP